MALFRAAPFLEQVVVTRYRIYLEDLATWHVAQSMDGSRLCDGSLTRRPMQDC